MLTFPDDFELGAASAATQIEGGRSDNSWYDWYKKGYIKDFSDPSTATLHYEKYAEDAELMRDMGIRYYRMGIEWARLEPEEGVFIEKEYAHYRDEITLLKSLGIEPLLTLHHFTNPMWFENKGGFLEKSNNAAFLEFVKKTVEALGDLVSEYITINEPNVFATNGYFFGVWPPGKYSLPAAVRVMDNMCECHIRAYELIHSIRENAGYADTRVSFAPHMRVFVPKHRLNPWHALCTPLLRQFFQGCVIKAYITGKASFPLKKHADKAGVYCDFLALNYYTRTAVTGFSDGVLDRRPVTDLGWEIYPEGIAKCASELYKTAELPIYITENGVCDNTDSYRARYISEHIETLLNSGLPVKRYYHWCFCDNFEWVEGCSARFGLVHVDGESQKRMIKKSGLFYTEMTENRGITDEMKEKYCNTPYYKKGERVDG